MVSTFVIFDIDGTLLHSNRVDSQCFADTYQDIYQKKFPSIDWRKYPHVTDTTIFQTVIQYHFGRRVNPKEIDLFTDQYLERLSLARKNKPQDFLEVPYAKDIISFLLGEENYSVGIATGGWERPARLKLAYVGIQTEPLFMSFADGKGTREEILQASIDLAKSAQVKFERVVYIGDAIWDVRTTRNMEIPFIGIRWKGDQEVLLEAGTKHVFQDFSDRSSFMKAIDHAVVPDVRMVNR